MTLLGSARSEVSNLADTGFDNVIDSGLLGVTFAAQRVYLVILSEYLILFYLDMYFPRE